MHAPAVGLCWTSYETAKRLIEQLAGGGRQQHGEAAKGGIKGSERGEKKAAATISSHNSLPLVDHMIAGSLAGMFEHAIVFPIDTIKTHIQAAAAEEAAARGAVATARHLIRDHGPMHLFRGLSALMPAIGPAHALMFSGYEQVLLLGGAKEAHVSPERVALVGALAGVVSTTLHDSCMVPAETIKQRLQLGYYQDAAHCFRAMLQNGGSSFFR